MATVFLSGGLHSGWQDLVVQACPTYSFADPRHHGLVDPGEYTRWNLAQVSRCDIVFAYMEASNPSGLGLAAEIGYAKALGKPIILVDERSKEDSCFAQHFFMVRETADIYSSDLERGIEALQSISRQLPSLTSKTKTTGT